MRVFLIGLTGCGKTTVGRLAANLLGWPFLDTDELVEMAAGQAVADLFAEAGEAAFRAREGDALRALEGIPRVVVACGGGLPMREENERLLRLLGHRVWLERRVEDIARCPETLLRPPIYGHAQTLSALLAKRAPTYARLAETRIQNDASPEDAASRLAEWVVSMNRLT